MSRNKYTFDNEKTSVPSALGISTERLFELTATLSLGPSVSADFQDLLNLHDPTVVEAMFVGYVYGCMRADAVNLSQQQIQQSAPADTISYRPKTDYDA
jgi:hypothetical protein